MKVLIIGKNDSGIEGESSAELLYKLVNNHDEIDLYYCPYVDLGYKITDDSIEVKDTVNGRDLAEYDAVFFRDWYLKAKEKVKAAALYLQANNIPFSNQEAIMQRSNGKLTQYMFQTLNGIGSPNTFYGPKPYIQELITNKEIKFPVVVKALSSSKGRDNFLARDLDEFMNLNLTPGKKYLIQEYIDNDCDYRVIWGLDEVLLVMRRSRTDKNQHLNNTSQGGKAELLEFSELESEVSEPDRLLKDFHKVSSFLGREFTGIDVLVAPDKSYVILETNNMPQIETGEHVEEKISAWLDYIKKLTKSKQ